MITLTHRSEQHLIVLQTLDRGEMLMAEAAALLGLSTRMGTAVVPPPRRVAPATRARLVHLARTTYAGVNHTHLSERSLRRGQSWIRRARSHDWIGDLPC